MESARPRPAVLVVSGILLASTVFAQGPPAAAPPAAAQGPPAAAPVEIEAAREEEFTPTAFVLGTTEPRRRSVVAASIEGHVVDYPVDEGMRVTQGTVLARLRDAELLLELGEAEASLKEIREQQEYARRDLERAKKLIETDAVTEKDLDLRATQERTLALRVVQTEARVAILKADIEKKKVIAPFDGQIVREHTEVGEWLPRGGAVATLVDISSVYVRVNVPERHVRFLDRGARVEVRVTAAGDEPFPGEIISISDEGDAVSRTFPVRIEVRGESRLRAGMSALVEIPAERPRRSLVVSKDAILLQGTRSYVFVIGDGETAERRDVDTGPSSGSSVAILAGLNAGDRVVVKGNERIQPGAPLRIVGGEQKP